MSLGEGVIPVMTTTASRPDESHDRVDTSLHRLKKGIVQTKASGLGHAKSKMQTYFSLLSNLAASY